MDSKTIEFYKLIIALIVFIIFYGYEKMNQRRRRAEFLEAAGNENYKVIEEDLAFLEKVSGSSYLNQSMPIFHSYKNICESQFSPDHVYKNRGKDVTPRINQVYIFDFQQTLRGLSDSSTTKARTLCMVEDLNMRLPKFLLQSQSEDTVLATEEVFFREGCKFSKRFKLTASDEHLVRYLFTQEVMEYFNRFSQYHYIVESFDNFLLFGRSDEIAPMSYYSLIRETVEIKDMLKETVKRLELY